MCGAGHSDNVATSPWPDRLGSPIIFACLELGERATRRAILHPRSFDNVTAEHCGEHRVMDFTGPLLVHRWSVQFACQHFSDIARIIQTRPRGAVHGSAVVNDIRRRDRLDGAATAVSEPRANVPSTPTFRNDGKEQT